MAVEADRGSEGDGGGEVDLGQGPVHEKAQISGSICRHFTTRRGLEPVDYILREHQ